MEVRNTCNRNRFALALAGGGAKGIYQIGAWEALRDLGVPLCAAVGASIGSLNAAFVAQGDYEAAMGMWQTITVEQCLNLPDDTEMKNPDVLSPRNLDVMVNIVRKRGLDTSPFRATIERVLDESRSWVRKSITDWSCTR
jgi:NTE family protein